MATRCKVKCNETREYVGSIYSKERGSEQVVLQEASFMAVSDGSEENKAFFSATPGLTLKVGTRLQHEFVAGQEYYLDFTPAAPPA